jgi:hypothetical protein
LRRRDGDIRRFFEDDVRIGAAESECADTGAARPRAAPPIINLGW